MGSNNEGDPKDPEYFPPDSSMDSGDEDDKGNINPRGDSDMEHGDNETTPPHRYPTRQRGFKRGLLELLNEPDYYVSPHAYPLSLIHI